MSTFTEIEHAVKSLPLAEQEALFRALAARLEAKTEIATPYRIKTHPGGVNPGVDPNRLGQLPEDF